MEPQFDALHKAARAWLTAPATAQEQHRQSLPGRVAALERHIARHPRLYGPPSRPLPTQQFRNTELSRAAPGRAPAARSAGWEFPRPKHVDRYGAPGREAAAIAEAAAAARSGVQESLPFTIADAFCARIEGAAEAGRVLVAAAGPERATRDAVHDLVARGLAAALERVIVECGCVAAFRLDVPRLLLERQQRRERGGAGGVAHRSGSGAATDGDGDGDGDAPRALWAAALRRRRLRALVPANRDRRRPRCDVGASCAELEEGLRLKTIREEVAAASATDDSRFGATVARRGLAWGGPTVRLPATSLVVRRDDVLMSIGRCFPQWSALSLL